VPLVLRSVYGYQQEILTRRSKIFSSRGIFGSWCWLGEDMTTNGGIAVAETSVTLVATAYPHAAPAGNLSAWWGYAVRDAIPCSNSTALTSNSGETVVPLIMLPI